MSFMLLGILNSQAAGGGGAAYELLESVALSSSASSVTFSGLGAYSDYKHLQIRAVVRSDSTNSGVQYLGYRFNGDSTSGNYADHKLRGTGSIVQSEGNSGSRSFSLIDEQVPGGSSTSNVFGAFVMDIQDFSSSSKYKTSRILGGAIVSADTDITLSSGLYLSTSAVSSINLFRDTDNLVAGSRFSLYGVK